MLRQVLGLHVEVPASVALVAKAQAALLLRSSVIGEGPVVLVPVPDRKELGLTWTSSWCQGSARRHLACPALCSDVFLIATPHLLASTDAITAPDLRPSSALVRLSS